MPNPSKKIPRLPVAKPPSDDRATGDSRTLRTYVKLATEERALDDKLAAVAAKLKELEPNIFKYFERMGMDRATIDGLTIYLRRELWAGKAEGVDNDRLRAAFVKAGLQEYVGPRLNSQSFSAFVREQETGRERKPGEGERLTPEEIILLLPAAIQPVIKVSEVYKIGTRKGK